jgi:peptidoglycan/xylan/chitin deacetylase (PgdA/CDA1 family)
VGILTVRLQSIETTPTIAAETPYAIGELALDGDGLRMEIQGTPDATVVLISAGIPIRMVTLDPEGRGVARDLDPAAQASIEIAVLAEPPEAVSPPPTATATSTWTSSPTRTKTSTRTSTPSSTPSVTGTATRTESPIRTSTADPTGTRTAKPPPSRTPPDAPTRRPTRRPLGPEPGVSPPVLHLVTDGGPRISLTFDGNASSNGTAELLDLLQELDLEITLFVTGRFIEKYPMLVRRAVLAGHEVGNHTYSHPHLTTYAENKRHRLLPNVTRSWFRDQLQRTEKAFRRATGRPMAPLWRSPYGEENSTLRGWALEMGYLHVRWSSLEGASLDARDWVADEHSSLYQDSRRMMDRLLGFPRLEGGIVLMHLATDRSNPPWTELPRFVDELERRNVSTARVTELLESSRTWRPWLDRARQRHSEVFPE